MLRIVLGLLALGQATVPVVDAVEGAYTSPKGGKVEVLGVCRIDMDEIGCWDRTGKADEALTKRIQAYYLPELGHEAQFQPGLKNRFVVFRRSAGLGLNVTDGNNGARGTTAATVDGEALEWARFALKPEEVAFDAFVNLANVNEAEPVDLPYERGRSVETLGYRFEVGESKPWVAPKGAAPVGAQVIPPGGKSWGIYWGQRTLSPSAVDLRFAVVDKSGNLVYFVDKSGQPISAEKFRESLPKTFTDQALWKGNLLYQNATISVTGGSGGPEGAFLMQTNVNPSRIGAIRIYGSEKVRIRFATLPADPM